MINKKTLLSLGAAGVVIGGTLLVSNVSAYGSANSGNGYSRGLENKASLFGMTTEGLQEQLQSKTFAEIAEDQGVTVEQMHEQMQEQAQTRWQEMGLSEEAIAERKQQMEERHANYDGECDGSGQAARQATGGRGYGRNK